MRTAPSIHHPSARVATVLIFLLGCGGSGPAPLGGAGGGGGGGSGGGGGGGGPTVTGQLLDGFGQPLSGRTVLIGTRSTTSDASGQFTLTGVTTPYDLVIVEPAPSKVATVYAQLTRTDPKLRDFGASSGPTRTATVNGNLVNGDPLPTPSGTLTGICWGSPESSTGSYLAASPYALPVSWSGPTSTTGSVHALQWTVDASGTVTGYRSHGVKTGVSLTAGNNTVGADLLLTVPLTASLSGTITVPAGYSVIDRTLTLTFADGAFFPVSGDVVSSPSFSFPVPSGIGASAIVRVTANNGGAQTTAQLSGLPPGTTGAALTLPAPALPIAPADQATGVTTSTDFTWTPVTGGVHFLVLSGNPGDPVFLILSGGSQARIPELSAQGLGLPAGRQYEWGLIALGPYASIDAFAATGTLPREGVGFQTITSTQFTTR